MIETRPYHARDEAAVTALYTLLYPHGAPRSSLWWWAHPTVIAHDGIQVIGYASFSISMPPTTSIANTQQAEIGWGHGMAVRPDYQGQGVGRQLVDARAALMRDLGLRFFIGHAAPGNTPMEVLFSEQGLKPAITAPQPDGSDLTYYMGRL